MPILLSKAIELFVTELTLRSWIYTEDTKRRTIQVREHDYIIYLPLILSTNDGSKHTSVQ